MAGDIPLTNNFNLTAAKPLDGRTKVNTIDDLDSIDGKYQGLRVFVVSEGKWYEYDGSDFIVSNPIIENCFPSYAAMRSATIPQNTWVFVEADEKNGQGESTAYYHNSTTNKRLWVVAVEDTEELI